MTAFDDIEEDIRRREESVKARELMARMAEIEKELDKISPKEKAREKAREVEVMPPEKKPGGLSKKMADVGKFCLVVVIVIGAIRLAAWVGTIVIGLGVTWMAYKLFLESK